MSTTTASPALQLDPGRIAAGAGAIAANGALLLLLLIPIAAPPVIRAVDPPPLADFVRLPPPPPPPPVEVEVRQAPVQPSVQPQPTVQPPQPPMATTDEPQAGDTVVPPADERTVIVAADVQPPAGDDRPLQGEHLQYAEAPPPPYPRDAVREGLVGTVLLEVLVDVDGRPLEVTVARSSGHRVLDVAARRQVLARWTFRPAMRDGRAVQAIGRVPVEFKLD